MGKYISLGLKIKIINVILKKKENSKGRFPKKEKQQL